MSMNKLRREIDAIDRELVRLLNERADTAVRIGERKMKEHTPVHDAVREDEVLARVKDMNSGPLSDEAIDAIYRRIVSACLGVQEGGNHEDL